jgi:hypothetical protein
MHPLHLVACIGLSIAAAGAPAVAVAGDTAPPTASATQPEAPAAEQRVTRSRSNIQNNRTTAPPAAEEAEAAEETETDGPEERAEVVKTKTKSNQSND